MTDRERAAVLVYDGVAELDAVGPYDVFATANRREVPIDAAIVTADPREEIEAIGGLTIEPDDTLDPADPPECLVVPGGRWSARAAEGAWAEAQRGTVPDAIAACHATGSLVAGVGAGVCLLAEAGLGDAPAAADGGQATSASQTASAGETTLDPSAPGAPALEARIAQAGRAETVHGVRTGIELALWLLEHAWGPDPARDVASMIEYDPDRDAAAG